MLSKIKLLSISFFILLAFVYPNTAKADNDSEDNVCAITVGSVPLNTSSNGLSLGIDGLPQLPASSLVDTNLITTTYSYNISVCGDFSEANQPSRLNDTVSLGWKSQAQWQTPITLSKNIDGSCYTGSFTKGLNTGAAGAPSARVLLTADVEFGSDREPICKRAFGVLTGTVEAEEINLEQSISQLCASFSTSTQTPISTEEFSYQFNIPLSLHYNPSQFDGFRYTNGETVRPNFRFTNTNTNDELEDFNFGAMDANGYPAPDRKVQVLRNQRLETGSYLAEFSLEGRNSFPLCRYTIIVGTPANPGRVVGGNLTTPNEFHLCNQIPTKTTSGATRKAECEQCFGLSGPFAPTKGNTDTGIWTAVGCIKTNPESIVQAVMTIGLSVSGAVALLLILTASFKFSISRGDQKAVGEARELLTSAVIGLIFVIFSITILQFIGFSIFRLPGFGGA